ncbi:MAG: c-type cytochrome [Limisphaerales bacterium]
MMRFVKYFLLPFLVIVVVGVAIAGKRGDLSRRPPIEVFPDMDRQLKLRPQQPNAFFPNRISSQPHPEGTIARSTPIQTAAGPVYPFEDAPVNTGRIPGTTNFVELNPMALNAAFLARGQERYNIHCAPCHSQIGDGNGITKKYGMAATANLHDKRIVVMTDGEIFNTVSHGKGLMQGYASQITVEDRWAIVAYLRALQLARLGTLDDVPEAQRGTLTR